MAKVRLPSLFKPSCKKICIGTLVLVVTFVAWYAYLLYYTLQYIEIETTYFEELETLTSQDRRTASSRQRSLGLSEETLHDLFGRPPPWNERLLPLIQDITQLTSDGYLQQMNMHPDGTAEYPMQEFWIYVGGTAKRRGLNEERPLKGNTRIGEFTCVDDPDVCDAYNAGFDRLLEYFHTHRVNTTSNAGLTFVDCDVTPRLCSSWEGWGVDPVMLIHIRTASPCHTRLEPKFEFFCTAQWKWIGLPLKKMPWTPTVRYRQGGPALPVFPSAYEQLKALVGFDGAEQGLDLDEKYTTEFKPIIDTVKVGKDAEHQRESELPGFDPEWAWWQKCLYHSGEYVGQAWVTLVDMIGW